ncbi:hypothetical protein C5167_035298 [Papaver somniferum]|uniref:SART-1 family protein n=1 Tax=Papaver somniferum TaxID=3469 RepID=A0A4Y7KJK7_PAPSO|nr:SART-1 family protein DOT2-like [Papaver somniferum]XP_026405152.1 SART-1 family protein DOT2-like [Papaver somniferum]XP_026405154.1 SART-1 family protein DOT2-like [Papaver somniferum]RZC72129.1 hypothetical protein C5167_035298 [Papaver somniferum]
MGKERKKSSSSSRREEKDYGSRDRREDVEEPEKEKIRDKVVKEREYDQKEKSSRDKERDRDSRAKDKDVENEHHHDRGRDRKEEERGKDREKERDRPKEREREKHKDREREKERDNKSEKEKSSRGKDRDKEIDRDNKDRSKDRAIGRSREDGHDRSKDGRKDERRIEQDDSDDSYKELKQKNETASAVHSSTSQIKERIQEMKKERLEKKSESVSEVLSWVTKSRKLEVKKVSEKEKALQLKKVFEEQDNIEEVESGDEGRAQHLSKDLAGVKILHGLDKVVEGGAVVLTLKDQSILADGDLNEEVDMLENVEIGEQKLRDDAYKAAKKKTGTYDDKFDVDGMTKKKMLPQYDDPVDDEVVTLDASGRFTGEAEKKLEELRKRLHGVSTSSRFEDLTSSGKISSDYYTQEEMLQFKKPKKKKSMRKKERLDLDALEAEAISVGLGVGDRGSRNDGKMQSAKEEQVKSEARKRSDAYQSAVAKAAEASKALRLEQVSIVPAVEDENPVFGDEDDELYKSLEKARKLALKERNAASGAQAVSSAITASNKLAESETPITEEVEDDKVVFTEVEEFVWGLQLDEEADKPEGEDVFMEEDEIPKSSDQEIKDVETGGWTEVNDANEDERLTNEKKKDIVPDATIHEVAVGKGLSATLQLLKERGTLKDTVEWGGRNMDKKRSKLVGIYDNDGSKEIQIIRRDEFGRIMTPKEAFRNISHKFHGKGPGKMKQEKRQKQYQEEMKLKQMKNSDTPSQSMERMREAQARMRTPYLVLSGHVRPGQTSDPSSGFATVSDLPGGGLTPMLGNTKVEHFLGIKRKGDTSDRDDSTSMGPPKKPRN